MTDKKPAGARVLRVLAALVPVKTIDGRVVYLAAGDIVPASASKESLEHLEGLGFIAAD